MLALRLKLGGQSWPQLPLLAKMPSPPNTPSLRDFVVLRFCFVFCVCLCPWGLRSPGAGVQCLSAALLWALENCALIDQALLTVEPSLQPRFIVSEDRVSLCSTGWPQAHHVAQDGQEPPMGASRVLLVCTIIPSLEIKPCRTGLVAHAFNTSTLETEAGVPL